MDDWFQPCTGGNGGGGGTLANGFMCGYAASCAPAGLQYREQHELITNAEINAQMNVEEDLVPQHGQSLPSSSSSSLRSPSGSPENWALLLTMASTGCNPEVSSHVPLAPSAYDHQYRNLPMPTPAMDTAGVLNNLANDPFMYQSTQEQARCRHGHGAMGAFRPYVRYLSPKKRPREGASGQRMSKMAITFLTRMHMMMRSSQHQMYTTEARPPSGNQLQHMISERKRREKLNDSFHALKMVLPPGSKKDKTSILLRAKDYVNALKSQVSELEEKNRVLESQLSCGSESKDNGVSGEKIEVQVTREAERLSEPQGIHLTVLIRSGCNTMDVALSVLQCLKETGDVSLEAMNTSSSGPSRAALTLQLKSSSWDDDLLKESVTKAVKDALSRSEMATP